MASPQMAPLEGGQHHQDMRDITRPSFRLELPDGTFITATSKKELIEKDERRP